EGAVGAIEWFREGEGVAVIGGTVGVVGVGSPLLYFLTFDFDPIPLRSPETESVSTLLDLGGDPRAGINSVNIVAGSVDEASTTAEKLQKLPEVLEVRTLLSFVPQDQDKKLELIQDFDEQVGPALERPGSAKSPSNAENIGALNGMADQLNKIAGNAKGPGADAAKRL